MAEKLPLFPLSLVAFPKENLNLHIFEPRYKQLIRECYEEEKPFGIPIFKEGKPLQYGTEMKLLEISKVYADDKMDIKTLGLRVFKLLDFHPIMGDKLYPGGEIEFLEESVSDSTILEFQEVMQLVEQLYVAMNLELKLPEWSKEWSIFQIAHKLALSFDQEVELLLITSESERLRYVKDHLQKVIPVIQEMNGLREKVQMNGHFKNVLPPNFDTL